MSDKTEKNKPEKSAEPVEKKEQKKPKKAPEVKKTEQSDNPNFKGIVRIAGRDIRGHVQLRRALTYVRGISNTLSVSVSNLLNQELSLPPTMKIGELQDSQIEDIDKILFSLQNYKLPKYLFNRRNDMDSGSDKHVIMNDLIFSLKQDLEKEKKIYTWKGYRHAYGQKVRGQRTRNTGRTGMAVGVLRKTIVGAAAAPAAGAAAPGAAAPAGGGAKTAAPAGGGKAAPAKAATPAAKAPEKK